MSMTHPGPRLPLAIWGAAGHAVVVADIVRLHGLYEIVAFVDEIDPNRHGDLFCGAPVLAARDPWPLLERYGHCHLIIAIGDCAARLRLSAAAEQRGYPLATVIHPGAIVASDVSIGGGSMIAAGAVVNPGARLGRSVIVNTGATIDHHCSIEDGAHVAPGAHLAGEVTIGRGAWVGIGAAVLGGVRVGAGAMVGAGAVVTHNLPDGVLAYGVPARIRDRRRREDHGGSNREVDA